MNQKHSTCLTIGLLLSAVSCPGRAASVSERSYDTITIHVYNYAAVPEKTLVRAKDEAGRVFGCAGLTALWMDHFVKDFDDQRRPRDSSGPWNANHFVLRLFRQARAALAQNAMGEALSFRIANVFMNRVKEH